MKVFLSIVFVTFVLCAFVYVRAADALGRPLANPGGARVSWSAETQHQLAIEHGLSEWECAAVLETVLASGYYDAESDTRYSWQWVAE